jgi:hypothetical protein
MVKSLFHAPPLSPPLSNEKIRQIARANQARRKFFSGRARFIPPGLTAAACAWPRQQGEGSTMATTALIRFRDNKPMRHRPAQARSFPGGRWSRLAEALGDSYSC